MRRALILTGRLAVALLFLLATGCKKSNQYAPPPAAKVSVAKPIPRKITLYLEATKWYHSVAPSCRVGLG